MVKIKPLSGEIDHLLTLQTVTLRQNGQEKVLIIEESSAVPPALVMRFAGYNSPESAKALNGAELLVNREDAAPLQPGEFYIEDLKALVVITAEEHGETGKILGTVSDIIEGGGGDLVEIRLNDGNVKLVPFRNEFFGDIDLEKKHILLKNLWVLE